MNDEQTTNEQTQQQAGIQQPRDKPYLSPTQLDMLCRCPEQYRRRYCEHEKLPPAVALLRGISFHHAAADNFRQKFETCVDLRPADIVDIAVDKFDREVEHAGEIRLDGDDAGKAVADVVGRERDTLVDYCNVFATDQAPDYMPQYVEVFARVEIENSTHDLAGKIDLADTDDRVVDFKTGARAKSQADADSSVQLTIYSALFYAHSGRLASSLRLDAAVVTKTKAYRSAVDTERTPADIDALAERFDAAVDAIAAGVFLPAVPGTWWCSKRFCGYYSTCRFVNGGRTSQGD